MQNTIHLAGISGSLRKGSFNTALLKSCVQFLPEGVTLEILSIELPLYNGDLDLPIVKDRPIKVTAFRESLAKADGLVIASPEYNYSIPGVLKNAIDWASRGADSPLLKKPVALMGATPGMWGTVKMQLAFLPVFQFLDMKPVQKPEIVIGQAANKFNEAGELTDETAKTFVKQKLENLKELILQLRK